MYINMIHNIPIYQWVEVNLMDFSGPKKFCQFVPGRIRA